MPTISKRYHRERVDGIDYFVLDIGFTRGEVYLPPGTRWNCNLFRRRPLKYFNESTGVNILDRYTAKRYIGVLPKLQKHKDRTPILKPATPEGK